MRRIVFLPGIAGIVFAAFAFSALAQEAFPIPELGNCENREACKAYCDEEVNKDACRAYAEARGMAKRQEQKQKIALPEAGGPGGCPDERACHEYCTDPAHTEECLAFAEKAGIMEKEEAERIRGDLKRGEAFQKPGPGGCAGPQECRAYCEEDSHVEECVRFGVENGFMTQEEADRALKFHRQTGPGGCKGEKCKEYCSDPDHIEECTKFAEENGLMPPQEAARARKFMKVLKDEAGPGGCRGVACREYCDNPEHREECFQFAKEKGIISGEEVKRFERGKKLEEKVKERGGPGGCTDEKSCMEYCHDPAHLEECVAFAAEHGGMDRAEAERMMQEFKNAEQFPDDRGEIRRPNFGDGADKLRDFVGPGGCNGPEECEKYCRENPGKCGPPPRGAMPRPDQLEFRREFERFPGEGEFRRAPEGGFGKPPQEGDRGEYRRPPEEWRPREGMLRPEGEFRPPEGEFQPPEGLRGELPQPEGVQPLSEQVPPSALRTSARILGNILFSPITILESLIRN